MDMILSKLDTNEDLFHDEIDYILRSSIPYSKSSFLGCFARDEIPWFAFSNAKQLVSLIVNTDTSDKPGQHLMCIVKSNNSIILWDSLARQANYDLFLPKVKSICRKLKLTLFINIHQFQPLLSNQCGFYCIWFILITNIFKPGLDYEPYTKYFSCSCNDTNFELNTKNTKLLKNQIKCMIMYYADVKRK